MKFLQLFNKVPNYKRFGYMPRHYDPKEEERKERELRIKRELMSEKEVEKLDEDLAYRKRIHGSFKTAKKTVAPQADPSSTMIRLVILMIITIGLFAFLEYGRIALIGVALVFIPFYLYLKFRKFRR